MVEMDALEDILWILTVCCLKTSKIDFIMPRMNLKIPLKDKHGPLLQHKLGLPVHHLSLILLLRKNGLKVDKHGLKVTYPLIRLDNS